MGKKIKTDGDIVKVAWRIDAMREKISDLLHEIRMSDHPNQEKIADALEEECYFPAWASHVIHSRLQHPDSWETVHAAHGIQRKTDK